jgi:hypothetical protein
VTPLPEDANPRDPRWAIAYLELAHGLVRAGAKAKLIERYTHLPHRRISEIYKALCGTTPPAGPMIQGKAEYFAVRTKHTSQAWAIQCGIFLECYERLERISQTPLHRGWRLLATYKSYLSITEKLSQTTSIKRLDINQAYALLAHSAFLTRVNEAEVKRQRCPVCLLKYPIVISKSTVAQSCPACTMSAHKQRNTDQGTRESDKFQAQHGT